MNSETEIEERVRFITGLTTKQITQALEDRGHDSPCTTCGSPESNLGTSNGKPALVNMPLVNQEGTAIWQFILICKRCANTKFIDAATVADIIKEQEPK